METSHLWKTNYQSAWVFHLICIMTPWVGCYNPCFTNEIHRGWATCLRPQKMLEVKMGFTSSSNPGSLGLSSTICHLPFRKNACWLFWLYAQFKAEKHDVTFWDTHFISDNLKMKLKIKQQSQTQAPCSEDAGPDLVLSHCHVAQYLSLWNSGIIGKGGKDRNFFREPYSLGLKILV